jgi:hypothetical protein
MSSGTFGGAVTTLILLCGAAPPDEHPKNGKHRNPDRRPHFVTPFNVPPVDTLSAYDQDGHLLTGCNIGSAGAAKAASKVVVLHLTSAAFNHLSDGAANEYNGPSGTIHPARIDVRKDIPYCPVNGDECVDDSGTVITASLPTLAAPNISYTRLDIDLPGNNLWDSDGAGGYKPIELEVILDSPNLDFIPNAGADDSRFGIQSDAATTSMFSCRQHIDYANNSPSIRFRINYQKRVGNVPTIGHLNIGVFVKECPGTGCFAIPIILDPHVPNSG